MFQFTRIQSSSAVTCRPTVLPKRLRYGPLALVAIAMIGSACDRSLSPLGNPKPQISGFSTVKIDAPVRDTVMGDLSPVARHLAFGLRNPKARADLAAYMKSNPEPHSGVDLQTCDRTPALAGLIAAGERAGGAAGMCAIVRQRAGVTLYMDPDRLKQWDPRIAPIVTAIDDPAAQRPASFLGYRTGDRLVELPADGSLRGPILVVLGQLHPSRLKGRQRLQPTLETLVRAGSARP